MICGIAGPDVSLSPVVFVVTTDSFSRSVYRVWVSGTSGLGVGMGLKTKSSDFTRTRIMVTVCKDIGCQTKEFKCLDFPLSFKYVSMMIVCLC